MKTKVITILAAVMLLPVSQVQAVLNIYSDAVIQEGDYYETVVNVYDTPPDRTTVDMTGGFVHNLRSYDSSIINMTGGEILTLEAYITSTANVSGGNVAGLEALDYSIVNLFGNADLFAPRVRNFGTLNMTGGTVNHLGAIDSGIINLYGGIISDGLISSDSSVVNIYGCDLLKTNTGGKYDYGQVYGFWTDSTAFTIDLNGSETYSHINLIPEPCSLLLLALGCLFLKRKK